MALWETLLQLILELDWNHITIYLKLENVRVAALEKKRS